VFVERHKKKIEILHFYMFALSSIEGQAKKMKVYAKISILRYFTIPELDWFYVAILKFNNK
jgi:hypothetical protein